MSQNILNSCHAILICFEFFFLISLCNYLLHKQPLCDLERRHFNNCGELWSYKT